MNMQCIVQIATPDAVVVAVGSRAMIDEGWCATVATHKSVRNDQAVNGGWSFPKIVVPNMGRMDGIDVTVGIDVALAIADALRMAAAFDVAALAGSLERAGLLAKP